MKDVPALFAFCLLIKILFFNGSMVEAVCFTALIAAVIYSVYEEAKESKTVSVETIVTDFNLIISHQGARIHDLEQSHESIKKLAEETKKLISNHNIEAAFKPRVKQ